MGTSQEVGTATGRRGMIVAGHPLATEAGRDVLAAGGSHADAAITAAAVLAVVLPQACTIGGDAFILTRDGGEDIAALNASGPSPRATRPDHFPDGMTQRGAVTATVPGVLSGWWELHRRAGRMGWAELLAPAIALARDGFRVSDEFAGAVRAHEAALRADEGCRHLFLPDGRPIEAGATLNQAKLADVLDLVARDTPRAFYDGDIARSIGAFMADAGGLLTTDDMRGFAADWVAPLIADYKGHRVALMPPNSYGLYMALQMRALERLPLADFALGSAERFACLIAAARAAFAEGRPYVADPGHVPDWRTVLDDAGLDDAMARRMAATTELLPTNRGGTAVVSVVDEAGDATCIMQSVFLVFGSAVLDPATGILFHDRMLGFSTDPGDPNVVAPRKRPAHTLNPLMVMRDGDVCYVMASPGGPGQTVTMTQVLTALVDHGVDPVAAVATPRWTIDLAGDVLLEAGTPDEVLDGLDAFGIAARHGEAGSTFFGSVEMIERRDGKLRGAADWRRESTVLGL